MRNGGRLREALLLALCLCLAGCQGGSRPAQPFSGPHPVDFLVRPPARLPSVTSSTAGGHIEAGDWFNHDPGVTGPDWADVGTYPPVNP